MIAIDFDKEWSGDETALLFTQKERNILLQLASNFASHPETFLLPGYDDEEVTDFNGHLLYALMAENVVHQSRQDRIDLTPLFVTSSSTTLAWTALTTQPTGGYWTFGTPAVDKFLQWDNISMKQGYWIVEMMVVTTNSSGIAELSLDGDVFASFDCYSAGSTVGVRKTSSSFVINWDTDFGNFKIRMHTKNASSSNYNLFLSAVQFRRTLDYP